MKTKFLAILVTTVFGLSFGASAQKNLGIRGGINIATISDLELTLEDGQQPDLTRSSNTGLDLALFAEFGVTKGFVIQPEITYIQKGVELKFDDPTEGKFNVDMNVNYLEVPVLAKFNFGENKLRANAFVGPSLGYALNGKFKFKGGGLEFTDKITFDNDFDENGEKSRRWDISAVFGGGLELGLGIGDIIFDARYGLDLNDFTKFRDGEPAGYKSTYNRGLALSVGYMIPIGNQSGSVGK